MGDRGATNEPATPEDIAAMAAIVARRPAGGRPRLLDLAHPRPPGHRRRARARHLRRRGRAVRHRRRARRARHRRVRAGPGRCAGRGPRRPRAGGRLDAAPVRRRRPTRSPSPCCRTTPTPSCGAASSTSPPPPRPRAWPSGPRSTGGPCRSCSGFQTFHPFNFTAAWGETGVGLLPWDEQVRRIQAEPELRARLVAEIAGPGRRPDHPGLHAPRPHLPAGRPARLRARARRFDHRHRRRARASTRGRRCST